MKDGHLNKCKECTKSDVHNDYMKKSSDESWMEKERERARDKYRRLKYKSGRTRIDFSAPSYIGRLLRARGFDTTNKEAHHWNYNKPFSVFLMSRNAHHRIHNAIIMSRVDKCCYTKDGVKIENEQQAKEVYESIIRNSGLDEEIQLIDIKSFNHESINNLPKRTAHI